MARGSNEVQASMDPGVMVVVQDPLYLQFFLQVGFKLSIDELNDGLIASVKGKKGYPSSHSQRGKQTVFLCLLFKNELLVRFHFSGPIL